MRLPANPVLEKAYNNTSGPVAYLDETFHHATNARDRFYVITAVLVERPEMSALRSALRQQAGGTFWRTTDQLLTEDGRKRAQAMLQFLGEGDEICMITHHRQAAPDDHDLEGARRDCLRTIGSALSAGAAPFPGPAGLMVIEERNPRNLSSLDRRTIKEMRGDGLIHRSMQTVLTSPKYEHLLWLPDLVSLAYRRTFTHNDCTLFSLVQRRVHITKPADPDQK